MPRVCTICVHQQRTLIEQAMVADQPNRAIAREWRVSKDAVRRHKAGHLPAPVPVPVPAPAPRDAARIGRLYNQIGVAQRDLTWLNEQLREARASRAVAMISGLTPGQRMRVKYEVDSLTAERDSCAARLAEMEAELAAHMK